MHGHIQFEISGPGRAVLRFLKLQFNEALCSICGRTTMGGRRNRLVQSGAGCAPPVWPCLESLIDCFCSSVLINACSRVLFS